MKIATWNLERPTKTGHKTPDILRDIAKIDADIWILTETNEFIDLGNSYNCFHTKSFKGKFYKSGDKQVSIYSKYPIIKNIPTFRSDTSLCLEINTPFGNLVVYGTIIGNFGNGGDQFRLDLNDQMLDFENLNKFGNFCVAGDLNISFSDNFYFTIEGRQKLKDAFAKLDMKIMTKDIHQNIDHIVFSNNFLKNRKIISGHWNEIEDKIKRLSDHRGVFIEILH